MKASREIDGQVVILKAAEPLGELVRSDLLFRRDIELRLYRRGSSYTLWLAEHEGGQPEPGEADEDEAVDYGPDLILQADYSARVWGDRAEAEANGHYTRLLEHIVIHPAGEARLGESAELD